MLEKLWHTEKENIEKNSVFWNMMSSGLNSVVSMFLLWIVSFGCGSFFISLFDISDDADNRKLWNA